MNGLAEVKSQGQNAQDYIVVEEEGEVESSPQVQDYDTDEFEKVSQDQISQYLSKLQEGKIGSISHLSILRI